MEADYNLLAKFLINKLLIPRGEAAELIPEESFCRYKGHRAAYFALCRHLLWDRLSNMIRPGRLGSKDAAKCYDRLLQSVALIAEQYWGLPLHTISMIISTLQVMNFSLRTGFGYLEISFGGTSYNPFQGICQGNGGGTRLWICIHTYIIKVLRQIRCSITLNGPISVTNKQLTALVFVDDTDIPVEGE